MISNSAIFNLIEIEPAFDIPDELDFEELLPQSEIGMKPSDFCHVIIDSVTLGQDSHGSHACIYNFDAGEHEICFSKRWHLFAHAWQMGDNVVWIPASESLLRTGQFLHFEREQYEQVVQGLTTKLPKINEQSVLELLTPPELGYLDPGQQYIAYDKGFHELHEIYERARKAGALQAWSPNAFESVLWASHVCTEVQVVRRGNDLGFVTFGQRDWLFEQRVFGTAAVLTNSTTSEELSQYLQCVFNTKLPPSRIGRQWLI